jgi:hypothetical protein
MPNQDNPPDQDELLKFVASEETIKKAVEGSMDKRAAKLYPPDQDELEEIISAVVKKCMLALLEDKETGAKHVRQACDEALIAINKYLDRKVREAEMKGYIDGGFSKSTTKYILLHFLPWLGSYKDWEMVKPEILIQEYLKALSPTSEANKDSGGAAE